MAEGFKNSGWTHQQIRMFKQAMRTPNPTMRNAMLRSVKKH